MSKSRDVIYAVDVVNNYRRNIEMDIEEDVNYALDNGEELSPTLERYQTLTDTCWALEYGNKGERNPNIRNEYPIEDTLIAMGGEDNFVYQAAQVLIDWHEGNVN